MLLDTILETGNVPKATPFASANPGQPKVLEQKKGGATREHRSICKGLFDLLFGRPLTQKNLGLTMAVMNNTRYLAILNEWAALCTKITTD